MPQKRLQPPYGGVADAQPFREKPDLYAPVQSLVNMVPTDPGTGRRRLATRPGLVKLFTAKIGAPVQRVDTVTRANAVAGYVPDTRKPLDDGTAYPSGAIAGNVFGFDTGTPPLFRYATAVDVSGDGGGTAPPVVAIGRHSTQDFVALGCNYTDGTGRACVRVSGRNPVTGAELWQTKISATFDQFVNAIAVSELYTLVACACSGTGAQPRLYALRNDTGAIVANTNANGWASQMVAVVYRRDAAGRDLVYLAFDGATNSSGTLPNGTTLTAGFYARNFRSGIMLFQVPRDSYATTPVFTQLQFGIKLAASDPVYEADHQYCRIADCSVQKPRGCLITSMAVDSTGNVYGTRCNAGAGPNSTYPPDLSSTYPITVFKLSPTGTMLKEVDIDSIVEVGVLGMQNDVPISPSDFPTLQAICLSNTDGLVFVGGRCNPTGVNVQALKMADLSPVWSTALHTAGTQATVREGCMRTDPIDRGVLVGGDRSTAWPGAGGANAQLWKLDPTTARVMYAVDDLGAIGVSCVAAMRDGRLIIGGDRL